MEIVKETCSSFGKNGGKVQDELTETLAKFRSNINQVQVKSEVILETMKKSK